LPGQERRKKRKTREEGFSWPHFCQKGGGGGRRGVLIYYSYPIRGGEGKGGKKKKPFAFKIPKGKKKRAIIYQ